MIIYDLSLDRPGWAYHRLYFLYICIRGLTKLELDSHEVLNGSIYINIII
jgi:hypothetical protein